MLGHRNAGYLPHPASHACLGALPNTQTAIANQIIANENGALTPIVKGSQPTLITSSGATLNGTVNTAGSGGRAYFQWSTNANLRSPTIACNDQYVLNCTWISASNSAQAFSTPVGGIASGTKIYYQAVFYTGSTYQYGAIQSFTTLVPAFNVTAASITSSGATLKGTVNTAGSAGYAYFQTSLNANFSSPTMACNDQYVLNCPWVGASTVAQAISTNVFEFASNTNVYYRAAFYNTGNSSYQYGTIQSFKTLMPVFSVTAASITSSGATLKGTVNTEGSAGYAYFQTSLNANFSSPTMACNDQYVLNCPWVGASTVAQAISTNVFEFASNTNVYYRAAFYNTGSYQYGTIQSFKTLMPVFSVTAASITSSGATLKGTVNTEGSAGYAYFQTSLNANFSSPTMACNDQYVLNCPWVGASTVAQAISTNVFEFASNTKVYYRAAFYNTGNSSYQYGTIQSFKTLAR